MADKWYKDRSNFEESRILSETCWKEILQGEKGTSGKSPLELFWQAVFANVTVPPEMRLSVSSVWIHPADEALLRKASRAWLKRRKRYFSSRMLDNQVGIAFLDIGPACWRADETPSFAVKGCLYFTSDHLVPAERSQA